MIPLFDQF